MSSLSLALPWQQELWQRLGQQYAEGRLAHAQLYSGSTGIGKHVFAEAMAVLLLCQNASGSKLPGVTACGQCRSCELLKHGYHPDLMRVAVEEGSRVIKIEQVRAITEFVTKTSHSDGAKVIVIRDVELLNTSSANALLKTLEEPSANCYLLLLSPNPGRLMATIRSRCQRIDFATPSIEQSKDWLQLQGIASDQSDALLGLAKGHPLLARDLSKSDLLQQRDKVLNAVVGILEKKQSPQTLMQLSKAIEIKTIVAAMSDLCADLVKSALSARGTAQGTKAEQEATLSKTSAIPPELIARFEQYTRQRLNVEPGHDAGISNTRALYKLYTKCQVGLKQLGSVTNPNPQLILEGLVWQIAKL